MARTQKSGAVRATGRIGDVRWIGGLKIVAGELYDLADPKIAAALRAHPWAFEPEEGRTRG